MPRFRTFAVGVLALAIPAALAPVASASASAPSGGPRNEFRQTNLVSDMSGAAQLIDPSLKNAWGLALGPATPLWVADNGTSVSTLYSITPGGGMVQQVPLTVTLPPMDSSPTGLVFNPTGNFVITSKMTKAKAPALFIFSSEGGQVIAWNPMVDPVMGGASTAQVEYSSPAGAVYKGLALASTRFGTFLYATDFHNGRVQVFNSRFHPVRLPGSFRDR
ncbi:MAG TPA: TIGR03118 family protein, partial [Streptosporangiaceae bacterium]|nr:TIGR03118 family protein [Streptosporangiaceae bacterium]